MGHRIAVLDAGVLQQLDPPQHVYDRPGEPLRRPVHRHAPDEHHRGPDPQRRRRLWLRDRRRAASRSRHGLATVARSRQRSTSAVLGRPTRGPPPRRPTGAITGQGRARRIRSATSATSSCRLDDGQCAHRPAGRPTTPSTRDGEVVRRRRPTAARCTSSTPRQASGSRVTTTADTPPRPGRLRGPEAERRRGAGDGGRRSRSSCSRRARRLRRVRLLPVREELPARPLPQPAVPGPAEQVRRLPADPRGAQVVGLPQQPAVTVLFAVLTVPAGILLGLAARRRSPTSACAGMAIYRTIFASTVATSVAVAVGHLRHAAEPPGRAAALARHQPDHRRPRQPDVGAARRGAWSRSGRTSGSASSSCRPACRPFPTTSSKPPGSTARAARTRFWQVTIPLLSPTIFFAAVVGSIFAFQTFGQIDLLTQGGPESKTNVLTYFIVEPAPRPPEPRHRRGALDRAVPHHPGADAAPAAVPRAAGALRPMTVDATTPRPHRRGAPGVATAPAPHLAPAAHRRPLPRS